nr:TPA_asm: m52.3 sORF 1 [Murid betaherpesvirus 1]DBA07998.1 TPA_asm: m52.3 sORF 1 [Murid betaherpesvirus 1]
MCASVMFSTITGCSSRCV